MAVALTAAPVGVAIAKRSGVSLAVGLQRGEAVRAGLGADFANAPVDDLTSCASKRPCLVREARQRGWRAVVVVETASALDDALLNVTLLSVEDDGREFARVAHQSSDAKLRATLTDALAPLRVELARLAQQPDAPVAPPPLPAPEVVATTTPAAPAARPGVRWVPMVLGLAALVAGGALEIGSASVAAELRTGPFVDGTRPAQLARDGASLQTSGAILLAAGGAITLGGALLALLWPEPVSPVVSVSPAGATFGLRGFLP